MDQEDSWSRLDCPFYSYRNFYDCSTCYLYGHYDYFDSAVLPMPTRLCSQNFRFVIGTLKIANITNNEKSFIRTLLLLLTPLIPQQDFPNEILSLLKRIALCERHSVHPLLTLITWKLSVM